MILTVHIDNLTIRLAVSGGEQPAAPASLKADLTATVDEYAVAIQSVLRLRGADLAQVEGAIVSSVVPPLTSVLREALGLLVRGRVLVVGAGIKTGLNIRLDNIGAVGSDFICNAVAALEEFAPPLVVIGMSGATTFSALDREGRLIGRSILPGVEGSLEELCRNSAQLPTVAFAPKCRLMGSATVEAVQSGILHGSAAMVEGMLERYEAELGGEVTAVATGDIAPPILALCSRTIHFRPNLLQDGLRLLYYKNTLS